MKRPLKAYSKIMPCLLLLLLNSCATRMALQRDYSNYSEVYGDSVNRQLLLNLARESRQEPTYFIQLGSIASQYNFNTMGGFTPGNVRTDPALSSGVRAIQNTLTLSGSLNASLAQNPIFNFFPLTGSNYVQAVLTPITEKVFWTFYDQGWPADQLARTMLMSIEVESDRTNSVLTSNLVGRVIAPGSTNRIDGTNELVTFGHTVSNVYSITTNLTLTHYKVFINDPSDPAYPQFLKYCNDLHNAQLFHLLVVDKNAKADDASLIFSNKDASLTQLVSAVTAQLSVKYDDKSGNYVVRKDADKINFLDTDTNLATRSGDKPFHRFFIESHNFANSNEADVGISNALAFAQDYRAGKIRFTTRTFEGAMNGAASEQSLFKDFENRTNRYGRSYMTFTNDPYGTIAIVNAGIANYPAFPVRPILVLQYPEPQRARLTEVTHIVYRHETYAIGDLEDLTYDPAVTNFQSRTWLDDVKYQNRTVFSIISYLFSQTATDTSKLPIQQLIQVQ